MPSIRDARYQVIMRPTNTPVKCSVRIERQRPKTRDATDKRTAGIGATAFPGLTRQGPSSTCFQRARRCANHPATSLFCLCWVWDRPRLRSRSSSLEKRTTGGDPLLGEIMDGVTYRMARWSAAAFCLFLFSFSLPFPTILVLMSLTAFPVLCTRTS